MSKRKRKSMAMSEPSTQLSITEFMTAEKNKLPEIKLEPVEKKIKLEFEDEEKDKN